MRISDWSSDVCSSDLAVFHRQRRRKIRQRDRSAEQGKAEGSKIKTGQPHANQRRYVRAVGLACITEADVHVIDKHVGSLYLGHHTLHEGDDVGEGSDVIAPACSAAVLAARAGSMEGGRGGKE